MGQGPLGVIPAALIRWPPSSLEEGIHGHIYGVFSNALSTLAMVGYLLLLVVARRIGLMSKERRATGGSASAGARAHAQLGAV
jgi:hypothetical protein